KNTPASKGKPAVKNRKELNVVLVRVKTNILGGARNERTGNFNPSNAIDEKQILKKALYQSLIEAKMIESDVSGNPFVIDLSNDTRFKQRFSDLGVKLGSDFVDTNDNIKAIDAIFPTLKSRFNQQTNNTYVNCLIIFSFNEPIFIGEIQINGRAENINKKSVLLSNTRNPMTLPHESMHSLGLFHTHTDDTTYDSNQKFVYHHAHHFPDLATDNYMSYNGILRKSTWHWQWKILKRNVK
ncbi:hypothetical protein BWG23_15280, partial [Flavobacterium oreochromis]